MKVLLLSPHKHLIKYLSSFGDKVAQTTKPLTSYILKDVDFIISYGYRHIISKDIIDKFENRIINLHISYLPWNRGADPNLWSFIDGTPKGVTIHYMDEGIDMGDIIFRQLIKYGINDTLRTVYERLTKTIEKLFIESWPDIREGNVERYKNYYKGSYHNSKDKAEFEHLLTDNWNTKIEDIIRKGAIK